MVTTADLPDLTEQQGEFLHCPECGAEFSATRGDYFMLPRSFTFECSGDPEGEDHETVHMVLVRRTVTLEVVKE